MGIYAIASIVIHHWAAVESVYCVVSPGWSVFGVNMGKDFNPG